MPVWQVALIHEANGRGWRETYYKNFGVTNFEAAIPEAQTLAGWSIKMKATPVKIKAVSFSDPILEGRQGQTFYFNPPAEATVTNEQAGEGAVSPAAAINITGLHADGNLTRTQPLRGVWDVAITQFNQLSSAGYAAWRDTFLNWRFFLLDKGYGFLHRERAGSAKATYSYVGTDQFPTFGFPANFFPEEQIDTYQRVRFSRFNKSDSPLNRELVIYVTARNAATSATAISAGPMVNAGRVIRYATPTFKVFSSLNVARVGRRSTGAPLLYTPGRRRNRPRS
jgi:hypothetical protein